MKENSASILILYNDHHIGDVLQRCAAQAAALRAVFPKARIDLMSRAESTILIEDHPVINNVYDLDKILWEEDGRIKCASEPFEQVSYDLVIFAGGGAKNDRDVLNTVYGILRQKNPQCFLDLGTFSTEHDTFFRRIMKNFGQRRELVNRVDFVLERSGMPKGFRATLALDENFFVPAPESSKPLVFIHTRSKSPGRCYPLGRELRETLENGGYCVWDAESEEYDLRELAWMIYHSDYTVTVDTAILHIANALNRRSLCIVAHVGGPWVGVDDFCFNIVPCSMCVGRKIRADIDDPCPRDFECMKVSPEEILRRVNAYFDIQKLKETPEAELYLKIRSEQDRFILNYGNTENDIRKFRLSMMD